MINTVPVNSDNGYSTKQSKANSVLIRVAPSSFLRVSPSVGMHALTIGAITTMIIAVAIRAGKGHTGRALTSDARTNLAFILITLAAVSRVSASLLTFDWLLPLSALFWLLAFLFFMLVAVPILVMPVAIKE